MKSALFLTIFLLVGLLWGCAQTSSVPVSNSEYVVDKHDFGYVTSGPLPSGGRTNYPGAYITSHGGIHQYHQ